MRMRYFTKRFTAYSLDLYEKKTGKEPMDLIDVGNLSVSRMILAIRVGNGRKGNDFIMSEEDAADLIDNFLTDENNSLIDVFLKILEEFDMDTKILKQQGMKIEDIRKELNEKAGELVSNTTENKVVEFVPKEEVVENDLKPDEEPKVDVNGFVSLDSESDNY